MQHDANNGRQVGKFASVETMVTVIYTIVDPRELRRCKRAQFTGGPMTLVLNGEQLLGTVVSIVEDGSTTTKKWRVKVRPKRQRPGREQ